MRFILPTTTGKRFMCLLVLCLHTTFYLVFQFFYFFIFPLCSVSLCLCTSRMFILKMYGHIWLSNKICICMVVCALVKNSILHGTKNNNIIIHTASVQFPLHINANNIGCGLCLVCLASDISLHIAIIQSRSLLLIILLISG